MNKTRMGRFANGCLWVAAALLACAGNATADGGVQERAVARGLFDQARDLMKEGKYVEACPKLEESQRLSPGVGTQFNLADCYENTGRAASAWLLYLEVASASKAAGQTDREKVARERGKAIEGKVSKLAVVVSAERRVTGMVIRVDGMTLGDAMWGTPMPMDAGNHKVDVSAPGKKAWSTIAAVHPDGKTSTLSVPGLEPETGVPVTPVPTASASTTPSAQASTLVPNGGTALAPRPSGWGTQKIAGVAVAGAGLIGFGIGGLLALSATSHYDDSSSQCAGNFCTQKGLDIRDEARSTGTMATVVGGLGLAALGAGAVLFFTAPSTPQTEKQGITSSTQVGVGPGWVTIGRTW